MEEYKLVVDKMLARKRCHAHVHMQSKFKAKERQSVNKQVNSMLRNIFRAAANAVINFHLPVLAEA